MPRLIALIVIGVWLASGIPASAQTGSLNKDPARVISKYFDLDMKGARLNSLTFEAQRPYIAWKEEPVWGQVVIMSGYEILDRVEQWKVINNVDVIIPVIITVLGSVYLEQATFHYDPHVERLDVHIRGINGAWRIVEPMLPPHVGQKRMVNYIRQALLEEEDPARAAKLTALRDEVRRAAPSETAPSQSADSAPPPDSTFAR